MNSNVVVDTFYVFHRKLIRLFINFLLAHILFDDAFIENEYGESRFNEYFRQFLDVIDSAARCLVFSHFYYFSNQIYRLIFSSDVHKIAIKLNPPRKYVTAYGGRLIWTLPGRNKLIVHLKDKLKVRVRKRWSQVEINFLFKISSKL